MMIWVPIREIATGEQTSHAFDGLDEAGIKKGTKAECGFVLGERDAVGSSVDALGKDLPVICDKCALLDPDVGD